MTLSIGIFFANLGILTWTDVRSLKIPNAVVLPAIASGIYFTGHWEYTLLMFLVGSLIFARGGFCGGDVKLMAMVGAFMGAYAFLILPVAFIFTIVYHKNKPANQPQPFTPFVFIPSLLFFWV